MSEEQKNPFAEANENGYGLAVLTCDGHLYVIKNIVTSPSQIIGECLWSSAPMVGIVHINNYNIVSYSVIDRPHEFAELNKNRNEKRLQEASAYAKAQREYVRRASRALNDQQSGEDWKK